MVKLLSVSLYGNIYILVGGFNHLEKYESMGRIIPYIVEKHVPNHQPVYIYNGHLYWICP